MNIQSADLRMAAQTKRSPQSRMLSLAIVGALHIAVIYALIVGITSHTLIPPEIPFHFIPDKPTVKSPVPPPHPENTFIKPQMPDPKAPDVDIARDNGGGITGDHGGHVLQPIPATAPIGLTATHTTPPYPELARRMQQEGTVTLRIALGIDGTIGDVRVEQSSGSSFLDDAAVAWVKSHWRYRPATQNGAPVASTTLAAVQFNLKNAR